MCFKNTTNNTSKLRIILFNDNISNMIYTYGCNLFIIIFLTIVLEIFLTSQQVISSIEIQHSLKSQDVLSVKHQRLLQNYSDAFSSEESYLLTELPKIEHFDNYGQHVEFFANSDKIIVNENKEINDDPIQINNNTVVTDASSTGYKLEILNGTFNTDLKAKINNVEYDEKLSGSLLDEYVAGKLSTDEAGNTLPIFLTEPESGFVVKNRPAVLKCKAAHALQLHFKCSGSSQPPPSSHDTHVDPHSGVHLEEVTATIHRDLIDEYFGKGAFKCECHAWSSRGVVKSQSATINIAYIRKQFATSPTSLRVEVGTRAELYCEPPSGFPEPKISWYKNSVPMENEHEVMLSVDSTLTFLQVSLQNMANYTCIAENIAGKRVSDSAVLIVYVNGGWSSWSAWRECKCSDNHGKGRKRIRICNNPVPLNGGLQCTGPQIQKSLDCVSCTADDNIDTDGADQLSDKRFSRWSTWSEWSSCSTECIQIRRRKCLISTDNGEDSTKIGTNTNLGNEESNAGLAKLHCFGKDIQTAECRGARCHIGKEDFDWTLYLGLAFLMAVFFSFGTILICCSRRSLGENTHYNMDRTVMDSDYNHDFDKKKMRMRIEAVNISYDYANSGCSMSEHHYDEPNLNANYTNPVDKLSTGYQTDTPNNYGAESTNTLYDINAKYSTFSLSKSTVCEPVNSSGGCLRLYCGEIMLFIPELAINKSTKIPITLAILSDENNRISVHDSFSETLIICSTFVHCSPRNYNFLKSAILKIPHCLINPEMWNVNIYYSDSDQIELNVIWRKIIVVGEETINTPVFVQLEQSHVYIMTELLGRFVVVADPKSGCMGHISNEFNASIKMKLIAFVQQTPSISNCILRIYVVKDFPNSKDSCSGIESQLGGTYMGESEPFSFYLNNCSLNIRVHDFEVVREADARELSANTELHEHIIPYNHILSNNSILHCEFIIKRSHHACEDQTFVVNFGQFSDSPVAENVSHSFSIFSQGDLAMDICEINTREMTVSIDQLGSCVTDSNSTAGIVQLPRVMKRQICAALDPPRSDERDWRLLANQLNTDRYIAYFATKPSPTEQILNLWECRALGSSHTIVELLMILKDMDRQDVVNIIADSIGPLWI